jgi:nicotinic acid mononucleotide adenylyltransferase
MTGNVERDAGPGRLRDRKAEAIRKRVAKVFARLSERSFIKPEELAEFRYYENLFAGLLRDIDAKIAEGRIRPLDFKGFPQVVTFPGYSINAGFYIGSFDPFQMTHLAMALKVLASRHTDVDVVFVVPEGHVNPLKPRKSEYRYRFDVLKMQVKNEFAPLIVPLDIGEGADTIEIVRRFIAMVPGAKVDVTHVVGSDVLPIVAKMMSVDLEAWRAESERSHVRFDYRTLVVRRGDEGDLAPHLEAIRDLGVKVDVERARIATPSSTDFRERHNFTILFPTDSILSHMEILFRYGMSKPWTPGDEE